MESMFIMKKSLAVAAIFSLAVLNATAQGTTYIGNLGDLWTDGGIGDIHDLFPGGNPYGTDEAHFTTGAGYYSLDSVTLEFFLAFPNAQWLTLQLFQQTPTANLLLGSLGNAVADPRATQWPYSVNHANSYTTFLDFSPLQQITLNPFSQYSLVASVPAGSPIGADLLFTGQ